MLENFSVKILAVSSLILLASCGSPSPARQQLSLGPSDGGVAAPPYFGLYAVTSDGLVRLNGDTQWEERTWNNRNDLRGNLRFLVFSRWLSMDATPENKAITLERVAHVRSTTDADGTVVRRPDMWASPHLPEYRIPLNFAPVQGHSDMLLASPAERLPPGLYSLSFHAPENLTARFGVAWPSVAMNQYDARYCVDKLPHAFVACEGDTTNLTTGSSTTIAIRDLRSSRTAGRGSGRLVIDGDVVNTSREQETVPPLSVVLLDARDQVLQSLRNVNVDMPTLLPGRSYHFRIVVTNAATNATRVRVTPAA
jgi:hypothetical protein